MRNIRVYIYFAVLAALLFLGCKPDDDCIDPANPLCSNYDPCHGGALRKADFTISNRVLAWGEWQFFADTLFGPAFPNLYFDALYPDLVTSHTWYLGSEVINQASFVRNFEDVPYPSNVTVSHVVTYDELDPCKPNDTGKDSVAVTFRLAGSYFEFASIGTFRGRHNGSEEYEWSVYPINASGDTAYTVGETVDFRYVNFHNTGEVADYYWHYPTNQKVSVNGDGSGDPRGIYTVDGCGRITFDYWYILQGNDFQFNGIKTH
ncbi:MAG: hypothetical protein ACFCUH_00030 [Flavobacteriales bacterium]